MLGPLDVATALAQVTQELGDPPDLDASLARIVTVARESIPSGDQVGISVSRHDGRVEPVAMTDPVVGQLDLLQHTLGEGPGMHAMGSGETVLVEHARHEQRWPAFISAAVRLGLRSQIGMRLHVGDQTIGALNVYSFSSDEISGEDQKLAELFAAHSALALGHARRLENLNAALASRKVIGLALGILMERLGIDEARAFSYLSRMAASSETKLRDVAAAMVDELQLRNTTHAEPPAVPPVPTIPRKPGRPDD